VAAVMAPVAERMLTHEAGARAYVQALHDSVPGRVRFRVQGLYRHPPRCQAIEEGLAGHRIVRSVTANPVTATVLVRFDPAAERQELEQALAALLAQQGVPVAALAEGAEVPVEP
jgi:hypothetical protein